MPDLQTTARSVIILNGLLLFCIKVFTKFASKFLQKMISGFKDFEIFFKTISYLVVLCGFISLWISGGFGIIVTLLFLVLIIGSWFLENSKWQISERFGTILIVLIVPLYYFGWKNRLFGSGSSASDIAGTLASMILILAAIKLLQKKSDKDWVFLYLISFFEVLLAAGLSISPLYLASFILYLLVSICAIVLFEIRKTSRIIKNSQFKETKLTRLPLFPVILSAGSHPFPSRTRKLSLLEPMILHLSGVGK